MNCKLLKNYLKLVLLFDRHLRFFSLGHSLTISMTEVNSKSSHTKKIESKYKVNFLYELQSYKIFMIRQYFNKHHIEGHTSMLFHFMISKCPIFKQIYIVHVCAEYYRGNRVWKSEPPFIENTIKLSRLNYHMKI